jgi:hypothetical protein
VNERREEQRKVVQEPQRATTAQSSGGEASKTKNEELNREMKELEDQYKRKKNLEARRINDLGQRLYSYEEGFTWCPQCRYVSNISLTSETRHNQGLKGRQSKVVANATNGQSTTAPTKMKIFSMKVQRHKRYVKQYLKKNKLQNQRKDHY